MNCEISSENNYEFFKSCVHEELIGLHTTFSWNRVIRRLITVPRKRYLFGWRLASYFFASGEKRKIKFAHWYNRRISRKYNVEIQLGAIIGPGMKISHQNGIVISRLCRIGRNFHIHQNTTIGAKIDKTGFINIGDNVTIGAHCCLIGLNMTIGNNVTIGAGTFLNKDLPDNSTCYIRREYIIITE